MGWTTSGNKEPNKKVSIDKGTIGDISFTAVWKPLNSYSISYDVNGGEGSIKTVLKLEGESAEIATASEVSRKGYKFVCWNTTTDGTGVYYKPGDSYSEDADIRLYAKWEVVKYIISYDLAGGTMPDGKSNPTEYTIESDTFILLNPERKGYVFVGWKEKDSSDETAEENHSIEKGSFGNRSFTAIWKPLPKYVVKFDANGADGGAAPSQLTVYEGAAFTVPSCGSLYKEGCLFQEWNTKSDGSGTSYQELQVSTLDGDVILFAIWKEGPLTFSYLSDSDSYSVQCKDKSVSSVVIPSEYRGKSVSVIGWSAFYDCVNLTSITIPESVTRIDSFAFYGCSELSKIIIPENVTIVGSHVFTGCIGLESIDVESKNPTYYGEGNCLIEKETKTLVVGCKNSVIPSGVTSIGSLAFYGCSGLSRITMPDGLSSIGNGAFYGCSGLTEITIPKSVETIGDCAFSRCSSLTTISIPERTAISIGDESFYDCSNLIGISIPCGVTRIGDEAFKGCSSLTEIVVPDSVTSIGRYAFYGCNSLMDITIPSGVTRIGDWAFYGCSSLTGITIPRGITCLEEGLFAYCTGLVDISIPENVTDIKHRVFLGCTGIKSIVLNKYVCEDNFTMGYLFPDSYKTIETIVIPKGVRRICDYAFSGCSNLKEIVIPYGVTSIGWCAFYYCDELAYVSIPESVYDCSSHAFSGCKKIKSVVLNKYICESKNFVMKSFFPDSYQTIDTVAVSKEANSIGDYAFADCFNLKNVTIPDSVTIIGEGSFSNCCSLQSIALPDNVTSISGMTFSGCTELKDILLPKRLVQIGGRAFENCRSLTCILIPDGVESIESNAFVNCTGLTSITIPPSVVDLGESIFSGCAGIKSVVLNTYACENFKMDRLFPELCKTIEEVVLPDDATSIGPEVFKGCSSLKRVTIPNNVTSIGDNAFYGCSSLSNIAIPDNVTYMGFGVFYNCKSLLNITIPNGITSIQASTFAWCDSLMSITIPKSLTNIGYDAFCRCRNLVEVFYSGTRSQWSSITKGMYWNSITGNYTIHCTDGDIAKN